MKQEYIDASLEIIEFNVNDIISTSGCTIVTEPTCPIDYGEE